MPSKQTSRAGVAIAARNARRAEYMGAPPESLFDTETVAAVLDVPPRTLEKWRHLGRGPHVVRVGRAARYRRRDVDSWLATGGELEGGQ